MGRRGPPKKPTDLKLLQGCPGGTHKLNPLEPRPAKTKGAKPKFKLCSLAKKYWREFSQKLEAEGILTELDLHALTRLCYLIAEWESLQRDISEKGVTYQIYYEQNKDELAKGAALRLKRTGFRPEWTLLGQIGKEINNLERQFGLSPSSRTGLQTNPTSKKKSETKNKLYG